MNKTTLEPTITTTIITPQPRGRSARNRAAAIVAAEKKHLDYLKNTGQKPQPASDPNRVRKPDRKPDKKRVKRSDDAIVASARPYQRVGNWKQDHPRMYRASLYRIHVHAEAMSHMRPAAEAAAKDYTVYAYEFTENYVYIGVTFNPKKRKEEHLSAGPVHDYLAQDTKNHSYSYRVLAEGLDVQKAITSEKEHRANYRFKGWKSLWTSMDVVDHSVQACADKTAPESAKPSCPPEDPS